MPVTVILRPILLVPAVAGIGLEFLLTAQAFAGGGGTHQQAQNAPPDTCSQQPIGKKTLPRLPPKKSRKKTQEEEF